MKLSKFGIVAAACALVLCFGPKVGWSTRAYGALISGEITAAPFSGEIEIEHHMYHVKPLSAAAKTLSSFYAGQSVDAVLDGPAGSSASLVISITPHSG
jgi:hypothetical protein